MATLYNIPEPTLRRLLIKRHKNREELPEHGGRFHNTFNDEECQELVKYISDIDRRAFGLSTRELRSLAFEFAEQNNIPHRFNKEKRMAGKDWLRNFTHKYQLSLRKPEATPLGRLMGFNKEAVGKFYNILKEVLLKYEFTPHNIYNADESGLSSVPTKLPKVFSPKGNRRVAKAVSAERGTNTTIICAVNAAGNYVPPYFIFGRVRMREELLQGAPIG